MASRRLLKKEVNIISADLMRECILCNCLIKSFDNNKLNEFAGRIIDMRNDAVCRICNPEGTKDRKRTKMYFKALVNDFNKTLTEIVEDMSNIKE